MAIRELTIPASVERRRKRLLVGVAVGMGLMLLGFMVLGDYVYRQSLLPPPLIRELREVGNFVTTDDATDAPAIWRDNQIVFLHFHSVTDLSPLADRAHKLSELNRIIFDVRVDDLAPLSKLPNLKQLVITFVPTNAAQDIAKEARAILPTCDVQIRGFDDPP